MKTRNRHPQQATATESARFIALSPSASSSAPQESRVARNEGSSSVSDTILTPTSDYAPSLLRDVEELSHARDQDFIRRRQADLQSQIDRYHGASRFTGRVGNQEVEPQVGGFFGIGQSSSYTNLQHTSGRRDGAREPVRVAQPLGSIPRPEPALPRKDSGAQLPSQKFSFLADKPLLKRYLIAFALLMGCLMILSFPFSKNASVKKVAIIGSGPAGISTAYHLSKLAKENNEHVDITIFEKKSVIGGRLALEPMEEISNTTKWQLLLNPGGVKEHGPLEHVNFSMEDAAGASLLASSPTLLGIAKELGMNDEVKMKPMDIGFTHKFDLSSRENRKKYRYRDSSWFRSTHPKSNASISSLMDENERYGKSVQVAADLAATFRSKSSVMRTKYGLRGSFSSLSKFADACDLWRDIRQIGMKTLASHGISEDYIEEVILPTALRRFGQTQDNLSFYQLLMALYEAEYGLAKTASPLEPLLEEMLKTSGAEVKFSTEVFGMMKKNEGWMLALKPGNLSPETYVPFRDDEFAHFDKVVLAAPFIPSSIEFKNTSIEQNMHVSEYKPRYVTFVGIRDELYIRMWKFGVSARYYGDMPSRIFSAGRTFDELARLRPVKELDGVQRSVYRIASQNPYVYKNVVPMFQVDLWPSKWMRQVNIPYTYTYVSKDNVDGGIQLDDTMWHTGGIESIGSSVELAAFMGRNVARLVSRQLMQDLGFWGPLLKELRITCLILIYEWDMLASLKLIILGWKLWKLKGQH